MSTMQLIDRKSETFSHAKAIGTSTVIGTTSISEERIYNSDNGDFLNYTFDGLLNVTFPSALNYSPYPMRDYVIYLPFSSPTTYYSTIDSARQYQFYTQQGGVTTNTEQISGYSQWPLTVFAVDTSNDTAWCSFPGNNIYSQETYTFYTTMANRVGDYLMLGSYTKYGNNLYRNNHLVKSISNKGYTTTITYNIDAYSEISQMTAKTVDSVANTKTTTYNLQYEKF